MDSGCELVVLRVKSFFYEVEVIFEVYFAWRASFCKSVAPKALMFISLKPSFYWHTAFSSSLVENFSRLFFEDYFLRISRR